MHIGIFVPVYYREEYVQNCLRSLINTNRNGIDILTMYIGINGANEPLRSFVYSQKKDYERAGFRSLVYDPLINLGKPKIINKMVEGYSNKFSNPPLDYVVSIDSDMVPNSMTWLNDMLYVFQNFKEKPIGALCANQTGNNCHVLDKDPLIYKIDDFSIITRAGNEGVAGGVLMTPYSIWKKFGGYEGHRIYASDDGHYALSCSNEGLMMAVINEVSFFHPSEKDIGYIEWKQKAVKNNLTKEEEKGYKW